LERKVARIFIREKSHQPRIDEQFLATGLHLFQNAHAAQALEVHCRGLTLRDPASTTFLMRQ
jgi:hypothetical protein